MKDTQAHSVILSFVSHTSHIYRVVCEIADINSSGDQPQDVDDTTPVVVGVVISGLVAVTAFLVVALVALILWKNGIIFHSEKQ